MGNGTKVALVALLILMVVVIARFVRDDSEDTGPLKAESSAGGPAKGVVAGSGPTGKVPASVTGARAKPAGAVSGAPSATTGSSAGASPSQGNRVAVLKPPVPVPSVGSPSHVSSNPAIGATGVAAPAGAKEAQPLGGAGVTPPGDPSAPQGGSPGASGGTFVRIVPPSGGGGPASTGSSRPPPATDPGPKSGGEGEKGSVATLQGDESSPIHTRLGENYKASEATRPAQVVAKLPAGPEIPSGPGAGRLAGGGGGASGPTPAPGGSGGMAAPGFPLKHRIEKGESYWTLAQRYYKNGSLWPHIEKANPGIKLLPGKELTIPAPPAQPAASSGRSPVGTTGPEASSGGAVRSASTAKAAPEAKPAGTGAQLSGIPTEYVVKKGDTLSWIAKKFYKDPLKFHLIEDANDYLKYQSLQEGARIKIPADR